MEAIKGLQERKLWSLDLKKAVGIWIGFHGSRSSSRWKLPRIGKLVLSCTFSRLIALLDYFSLLLQQEKIVVQQRSIILHYGGKNPAGGCTELLILFFLDLIGFFSSMYKPQAKKFNHS
jgi:hypothetical protein